MTAEGGTLGDFLLQEYNWQKNPLYVNSPTYKRNLLRLWKGDNERIGPAKEMLEREGIKLDPYDSSGLGLISAVDKANPGFANRAVMQLFCEMLKTITMLHNWGEDTVEKEKGNAEADGWAHRDIKPANFLLEFNPPNTDYKIKATDLGFVIGSSVAGAKGNVICNERPRRIGVGKLPI